MYLTEINIVKSINHSAPKRYGVQQAVATTAYGEERGKYFLKHTHFVRDARLKEDMSRQLSLTASFHTKETEIYSGTNVTVKPSVRNVTTGKR